MFKLKTIVCFLTVFITLSCHIVYAQTLAIGNYAVQYSVPEGYIEVNRIDNKSEADIHYISLFTELYKTAGASFVSLFMEKEYHEIFNDNQHPIEYVTIFYINDLVDTFFSDTEFSHFKEEVRGTLLQEIFTIDINGSSINVPSQTVLKDESNIFSFSQIYESDDEQRNTMFVVTNLVNIEGIVLNICYTSHIKSQADIDATLSSSDFFVKNLNLKPVENQRPALGSTSATTEVTRAVKPLLLIFGGVALAMALLVGGLFFFLNRNKKK